MSDKELKKEKEELRSILFEKISQVKSNTDIKEIYKKVESVKLLLDYHDSKLENLLEDLSQFFSSSTMAKIKKFINDILDNYDQIDKKNGNPVYSDNEKAAISKMVEEINSICNRNFWDRFTNVLKGS